MAATREDVGQYERRYGALFSDMREDWQHLKRAGKVARAEELTKETGEPFRGDIPPQYFVGDLDATFVLVHLNPKEGTRPGSEGTVVLPRDDFDDYFLAQRWFGRDHYGPGAKPWKSPFDHKQVRFLAPFGVIDFSHESPAGKKKAEDLERVIDRKLQLELIPYASPSFRTERVLRAESLVNAHYERVLAVITATPRRYVIFCGQVFDRLLKPQIVARHDHFFQLAKADGTHMRQRSRFSKVTLQTRHGELEAGIAQSFARQGMPMREYGREIQAAYA